MVMKVKGMVKDMKESLSPKVKALYEAVSELISENVDVRDVKVSDITGRAGIGKGTAYEYFSNKEEIISSALIYHIDMICSQVMTAIDRMEDFAEMVDYLLVCMDREIPKRDCLIQFIQLLTDNSLISQLLHRKIKESNSELCMPQTLIDRILQKGIRQGYLKEQLPFFYMRMVFMSKVMVYALYITSDEAEKVCDKQQMHRLLYEGLIKELG